LQTKGGKGFVIRLVVMVGLGLQLASGPQAGKSR